MRHFSSFLVSYCGKNVLLFSVVFLLFMTNAYGKGNVHNYSFSSCISISEEVQNTVFSVKRIRENKNIPFAVIDKKKAAIFVFDSDHNFIVAEPVLLGIAKFDKIDPRTVNAKLSAIKPDQRVTPSGSFKAKMGRNHRGKELLWVDYEYSIAIHPVVHVPSQNREKRLKTREHTDNRITWGCINVSPELFKTVLKPLFKKKGGMVYILPEESRAHIEQF